MLSWLLLRRCFSSAFALECARSSTHVAVTQQYFLLPSITPLSSSRLSGLPHPGDGARQPFVPNTRTLSFAPFIFPLPLNALWHSLTLALTHARTHTLTQTHPHSSAGWGIHGLGLTKTLMCGAARRRRRRDSSRAGLAENEEAPQRKEEKEAAKRCLKTASRGE